MPKLANPLTDVQVRNAKPKAKPYTVSDGGGLFLLVSPDGSKYWRFRYRFSGSERILSLGKYMPGSFSLADARDKRIEARKLLAQGIDPAEHKKEQARIEFAKAEHTFEKLAREWHSNKLATWSEVTASAILRRLEIDIFPEIGALPIGSITHQQMIAALRKIENRGAIEVAHRVKANCARIFRYANLQGIENKNPASDLTDVLKPPMPGHFAAITADELPAFLLAMEKNEARLFKPTRIVLRLMLLLFVRTSELITTPWSEINLKTGEWTIPWTRMKRGKRKVNPDTTDHNVCMSRQALELFRDLHELTGGNTYVFPNQRIPDAPMSNGAILMALRRMGYQNKMTGHGFRALAMSTIKERLGYRHEAVDRQLAHAQPNKIASAYDRAQFIAERKLMMQDWADYLDKLLIEQLELSKKNQFAIDPLRKASIT